MRARYGRLLLGFAVLGIASVLCGGVAWSVDDPAGIMRLLVDPPEWVIDPTETGNGAASRFQLETLLGSPTTVADDNKIVASILDAGFDDLSSITTISINGSNPLGDPDLVRVEDLSNIQDGGGREFWPLPPTERTRDVVYRMLVPIEDDDPIVALEIIEVQAELVLLRDTVKLDFILTNRGTQTHYVGLRHFVDCQFGGGLTQADGQPIFVSDGTVVDTETTFRAGIGNGVPEGWVAFDSLANPGVVLRGTLRGGEVDDAGRATYSAGVPDRLEFGQRINCGQEDQYDFTPTGSFLLTGEDWGYAVRWDEEPLAVGASRRYVTYYGLGSSASDFAPSYVLAAYAPFELQAYDGDDPLTAGTVENGYLGDANGSSIWEVHAYCDNFGSSLIPDARMTLSLPDGLELDTTGGQQQRTVLVGAITPNAQAHALWRVRATETVTAGVHEIRVTGPLGKAVRRKIGIPALPTLRQDGLDPFRGLSMVSVPYRFQITDAEHVFQSLGGLNGSNTAALVRWDPVMEEYHYFPHSAVTNIQPAYGYWLVNRLMLPIIFPDPPDRQPVPITQPYAVALDEGWNQIGTPFLSTIRFDQATVVGPDGLDRTLLEAANAGLVMPTLFAYDPSLHDYTYPTEWTDLIMEPYAGYWFRCYRAVTLVLPAPTLLPFRANPAATPTEPEGTWRVPLVVSSGSLVKPNRAFGASPQAQDGLDLLDVMSPPDLAAADGARLHPYFLRTTGTQPGAYYADMRSSAKAKQTWTLVVDTDLANQPVTLSWPELFRMPSNLVATLDDLQAGRSCYMRSATSYTYNAGPGGPRQFRLTVSERNQGMLQIMGFVAAPVAAGVRLSYTLNAPAAVDVTIRNLAGRVVKRVLTSRETPAGDAGVVWTGQADNGLAAPNGTYVVEIVARSPENGERTGLLRSVQLRR